MNQPSDLVPVCLHDTRVAIRSSACLSLMVVWAEANVSTCLKKMKLSEMHMRVGSGSGSSSVVEPKWSSGYAWAISSEQQNNCKATCMEVRGTAG